MAKSHRAELQCPHACDDSDLRVPGRLQPMCGAMGWDETHALPFCARKTHALPFCSQQRGPRACLWLRSRRRTPGRHTI
eukprot:5316873-Prymnesium_polylepis.1